MSQITIYLEPKLEKKMRQAVKKSRLSQSRWLANLIHKECDTNWPAPIRQLAGSWNDFPSLGEIRRHQGHDTPRESF